jgi:hypothetical protein
VPQVAAGMALPMQQIKDGEMASGGLMKNLSEGNIFFCNVQISSKS